MTHEETVLLTRYVRACCPQQAIDEYTPDAWHDLLGDLDVMDCRRAVVEIVKRQPFVAPSEIRAQVQAMSGTGSGPHSSACRGQDCRNCLWSWCTHGCHQTRHLAIVKDTHGIAARKPEKADATRWADEARRFLAAKET